MRNKIIVISEVNNINNNKNNAGRLKEVDKET